MITIGGVDMVKMRRTNGMWVVLKDGVVVISTPSFEEAYQVALEEGKG